MLPLLPPSDIPEPSSPSSLFSYLKAAQRVVIRGGSFQSTHLTLPPPRHSHSVVNRITDRGIARNAPLRCVHFDAPRENSSRINRQNASPLHTVLLLLLRTLRSHSLREHGIQQPPGLAESPKPPLIRATTTSSERETNLNKFKFQTGDKIRSVERRTPAFGWTFHHKHTRSRFLLCSPPVSYFFSSCAPSPCSSARTANRRTGPTRHDLHSRSQPTHAHSYNTNNTHSRTRQRV